LLKNLSKYFARFVLRALRLFFVPVTHFELPFLTEVSLILRLVAFVMAFLHPFCQECFDQMSSLFLCINFCQ